mmetsp:Transcript_12285/g.36527  ORF Transcript_12285/g.36527 Transcript_12285/m.36527 type:complete len:237 (+) Transcript_12285:795-1505(+)
MRLPPAHRALKAREPPCGSQAQAALPVLASRHFKLLSRQDARNCEPSRAQSTAWTLSTVAAASSLRVSTSQTLHSPPSALSSTCSADGWNARQRAPDACVPTSAPSLESEATSNSMTRQSSAAVASRPSWKGEKATAWTAALWPSTQRSSAVAGSTLPTASIALTKTGPPPPAWYGSAQCVLLQAIACAERLGLRSKTQSWFVNSRADRNLNFLRTPDWKVTARLRLGSSKVAMLY